DLVDHRRWDREIWGVQHDLGRAHLYWHAAHRVFRNRRAEEEVLAGPGERRDGRSLRAFRIVLGLRRFELPDPGEALARGKALHAEWREDVDHKRRVRRSVHRVCQD